MGSLFDSPITLIPLFLALVIIATIGVGVIVLVTHSTARQNQSRYERPSAERRQVPPAGGQRVPRGAPPWHRSGSDPVPGSTVQRDGGQNAPRPGFQS
jgi:hypothetical protein